MRTDIDTYYDRFYADWPRATQRQGQWAFNLLNEMRPDLANKVYGNYVLDPFYQDEILPAFFEFINESWEES